MPNLLGLYWKRDCGTHFRTSWGEISRIQTSALLKDKYGIRADPVNMMSGRLALRSDCGGKKKLICRHLTTLLDAGALHHTDGRIGLVYCIVLCFDS
jgi:hypothetical protein